MYKISYISLVGLIGSIVLTSCSKGSGNNNSGSSNNAASSQPSEEPKPNVPNVSLESCVDIIKPDLASQQVNGNEGNNQEGKKEGIDIISALKQTKVNLCNNIENTLNGKLQAKQNLPVNTFSDIFKANIQLGNYSEKDKPNYSFEKFNIDGTTSTDLVSNFIDLNSVRIKHSNIMFAFAGTADKEATENGFTEIRFITKNGNVHKAVKSENGKIIQYKVEAKLTEEYVKNLVGVFVVSTSTEQKSKELYLLKNDGTYDVKDIGTTKTDNLNYEEISSGNKISELFPMIPEADIASIANIQMISDSQMALNVKTEYGTRIKGYYLISIADLKKADAKATFVTALPKMNEHKNCEDVMGSPLNDVYLRTISSVCSIFKAPLAPETGTPYLNAYSNNYQASLFFAQNNSQYRIINNNGVLEPDFYSSAGTISNDFLLKPKVLAFGEVPNSKPPFDIQFVNNDGGVIKANSVSASNATYIEIKNLGQDYVKEVFGAFLLPEALNNPSYVYFLKKNGEYDIKDSANDAYSDVTSKDNAPRKTANLFPMIPAEEIASIDFVQKLPNQKIALFKKVDNKYVGYYVVSTVDVANNNENGEAIYVAFEKENPVEVVDPSAQPVAQPQP